MKYFHLKVGQPGYRLFLRIAFPIGKRSGSFYDVWYDARFVGPHVRGRVIEAAWKYGKRPCFTTGTWAVANGPVKKEIAPFIWRP